MQTQDAPNIPATTVRDVGVQYFRQEQLLGQLYLFAILGVKTMLYHVFSSPESILLQKQ